MKEALDALRAPDASRMSEALRSAKPADNPGATITSQIQAMQKALKEDEELVVLVQSGEQTVRVLEFFLPSWQVVVLTGIDTEKNLTRIVSHIESVQLICKVMKVQVPAKPARIGFVIPKPKPE